MEFMIAAMFEKLQNMILDKSAKIETNYFLLDTASFKNLRCKLESVDNYSRNFPPSSFVTH